MIDISSAQLDALLIAYAYPAARILGLMTAAPLLNNKAVPARIRLTIGLLITLVVAPTLQIPADFSPGSYVGISVLLQEMLIGIGMGFAMRIIFVAIDVAGDIIGLQMGLSFATFYDPQNGAQTAVLAEYIGLLASLIFLALNGHLLMIDIVARSFAVLPISSTPMHAEGWLVLARAGTLVFSAGLLLALPIVAALLITNIALGVLTRAAPQMNLFAIGFPITSTIGFVVLLLTLDVLAPTMQRFFEQGFDLMGITVRAWGV